jgi:hypothetical protein
LVGMKAALFVVSSVCVCDPPPSARQGRGG